MRVAGPPSEETGETPSQRVGFRLSEDELKKLMDEAAPALKLPMPRQPIGKSEDEQTAELPERLPLFDFSWLHLGLRLDYPDLTVKPPESLGAAFAESLRGAEIREQRFKQAVEAFTGKTPTGWEAVDKMKLAKGLWGIAKQHLPPDLVSQVGRLGSVPIGPGKTVLELDVVIQLEKKGGGLLFTVRY